MSLGRLIWQYFHNKEIPDDLVIDHGNDFSNLCTISNLSPLTQKQNLGKLRYPKRIVEHLSICMISHPKESAIKLLRFKDDIKQTQDLLIYSVLNDTEPLLCDLNSFKKVVGTTPSEFQAHFENLGTTSKSFIASTTQTSTGDSFADEIYSYSVDWTEIDNLVTMAAIST